MDDCARKFIEQDDSLDKTAGAAVAEAPTYAPPSVPVTQRIWTARAFPQGWSQRCLFGVRNGAGFPAVAVSFSPGNSVIHRRVRLRELSRVFSRHRFIPQWNPTCSSDAVRAACTATFFTLLLLRLLMADRSAMTCRSSCISFWPAFSLPLSSSSASVSRS